MPFSAGVFLFLFISFSLYFFLSLFHSLSLFVLFNLGGSFVLMRVKQAMGFYRVFIIKIRGGGVCAVGKAVTKKKMKKYKRTSWIYSITR